MTYLPRDVVIELLKNMGPAEVERCRQISKIWRDAVDERPHRYARFVAKVLITKIANGVKVDVTPTKNIVQDFGTFTVRLHEDRFQFEDEESRKFFRKLTDRLPGDQLAPQDGLPFSALEMNFISLLYRTFSEFVPNIRVVNMAAMELSNRAFLHLRQFPDVFKPDLLDLPYLVKPNMEYENFLDALLSYTDREKIAVGFTPAMGTYGQYNDFRRNLSGNHKMRPII